MKTHKDIIIYHGNEPEIADCIAWIAAQVEEQTIAAQMRKEPIEEKPAELIQSQLEKGLCVVALRRQEVVGFCTLYDLGIHMGQQFWEVGSMMVWPDYRRDGLGHKLYQSVRSIPVSGIVLGTSKNLIAIKTSLAHGFEEVTFQSQPSSIRPKLCHGASCWKSNGNGRCTSEIDFGGPCNLRRITLS